MRKIRDLGINVIPGTRPPENGIGGFFMACRGKSVKPPGPYEDCDSPTCNAPKGGDKKKKGGAKKKKSPAKKRAISRDDIRQLHIQLQQRLAKPDVTI